MERSGHHYMYLDFPKETPKLKFQLHFFFPSATVCESLTRMHDDLTLMSTWHDVMADKEKFMLWKISTNTVYNTFKMDTKYLHSVRGRPTLKDEERFSL